MSDFRKSQPPTTALTEITTLSGNSLINPLSSVKPNSQNAIPGKNYLADETFEHTTLQMHRFRLFFHNKLQELDFRYHYYSKSRSIVKVCIIGLLIISVIVFFVDVFYYKYGLPILIPRLLIRGVIQIPIEMAWIWFVFYRVQTYQSYDYAPDVGPTIATANRMAIYDWDRKNKHQKRSCVCCCLCFTNIEYHFFGGICASIIAICILLQTIVSQDPDHGLYMLYFFIIYLFVGLPFFFAFVINWLTYVIFLVSMLVIINDYSAVGHFGSQSFKLSALYLTVTNFLLTIAAYSLERSERNEFLHKKELEHQQNIVSGLLKDLLPGHVMEKLRSVTNNDWMIAENVEECTILFSDLVSFTKWSSKMPADQLIQRLHELYTCFDELVDLNRVYKVETIGDAYFVSSNCPIMVTDHAQRCLLLGRHMMEACRKLDWSGYTPKMRIGIHTGSVIAGVVGRKMPRYHLFGKTVLIAEELESSGMPDKLHISESTVKCLKESDCGQHSWIIRKREHKQSVLHGEIEIQTYFVHLDHVLYQNVVYSAPNGESHRTRQVI